MKKKKPFLWFLAPGFIFYCLFVIYPIFSAARISFYKWNGIGEKVFVGVNNYVELFTNPVLFNQLLNALKHSLILFILTILIMVPLQIMVASRIMCKWKIHSVNYS